MDKELQIENGNYTRIVNRVLDELVKMPLLGAEFAVCLFIIRKTYGYQKKEDEISLDQFQEGTKISRPTLVKALKNLQLVNMVLLVKKGVSKRSGSVWKFNKYYTSWKPVNRGKLVKKSLPTGKPVLPPTGKPVFQNEVKTGLLTKERKKERKNAANAAPVDKMAIKKAGKRKVYIDKTPMTCDQFLAWIRRSKMDHLRVIAEWTEAERPPYSTKGQWSAYISRNGRVATRLAAYTNEQLQEAYDRLQKDIQKIDKKTGKKVGFITKYTLETLEKYI